MHNNVSKETHLLYRAAINVKAHKCAVTIAPFHSPRSHQFFFIQSETFAVRSRLAHFANEILRVNGGESMYDRVK